MPAAIVIHRRFPASGRPETHVHMLPKLEVCSTSTTKSLQDVFSPGRGQSRDNNGQRWNRGRGADLGAK
eukprot:g20833.t1